MHNNPRQTVFIISLSFTEIQGKPYLSIPDYYNYYYGGYAQNPEAPNAQEEQSAAAVAVEAVDGGEATAVTTSCEGVGAEVASQPDNSAATSTEVRSITVVNAVFVATPSWMIEKKNDAIVCKTRSYPV